jgi:2-oxoglutarate ferredoxin oxidoreductase subunit beta
LVEVLSMCPTGWETTPLNSLKYIADKMMPLYPLGVYRSPEQSQQKEGGAA